MIKIIPSTLTPEFKAHVFDVFAKHAVDVTGINGLAEDPTCFKLMNNDILLGCIVVQLFWGQLHIKHFMVEEPFRHKGYGSQLIAHALNFGKIHGCRFAFVETMNFQAPDFYMKHGFEIEFIRNGFDKDSSFIYLKKNL